MNLIKTLSLFLLSALILTACGGGGGGGGGGSATPSLPSDAVTIDTTNATAIATSAVATADTAYTLAGVDATNLPDMQNIINKITETAFNRNKQSVNVVTGITDTIFCTGGSITDTYSLTSTSSTGSFTFNSCAEFGLTFNGTFSYNYTWDNATDDYTGTVSGSLTLSAGGNSFTMALNLTDTGNFTTEAFSATMSFSLSGVPGAGFLVTTETPLTGTFGIVSGGQLLIQGANNTRLRITVTSSTTANVDLDDGSGSFVRHLTGMAI